MGRTVTMVRGPAIVRVDGTCSVLGVDVSGRQVNVRAGKALPFEPAAGCRLDVSGESWLADPLRAGTQMWERIAGRILARRQAVVMLVGGTDTGKSTFSIYLANMAIRAGIVACVIDGDIGQGDLAPPGAIGCAIVSGPAVDLRDVAASFLGFVGSTTSAGSERQVASKMRSILGMMRGRADLCIINTDGYVSDGGLPYKRMLARVVRPDIVVVFGRDRKLAASMSRGAWLLLRARSADQVAKTRQDRVGRRAEQFMRYIGNGTVEKSLADLQFVYRGRRLPATRALSLLAQGMFVGLGSRGWVAGFGLVEAVNVDGVAIKTGVQDFTAVYLSNIGIRDGEVRL